MDAVVGDQLVILARLLMGTRGCNGSFSAGHDHELYWSNPVQMTDQVDCKWGASQCNYLGVSGSLKVLPNQRRDDLGFPHHHSRTIAMSDNSKANVATADALTLHFA